MKTTLFLCALAANAFAATPILVRVTPQTLADLQARDPMIRLVKPEGDRTKVARPMKQSIINESTILHDGKNWTLVPKDAVVFLPSSLKTKVNIRPVGTLLAWADFLKTNQDWITTKEVTFDQAAGNEAISTKQTRSWAKQGKIVVAVHHQGPISVRVAESSTTLTMR